MFQSICDMVFFIVTVFSNNSNIYKSPLHNSGLQLITRMIFSSKTLSHASDNANYFESHHT